MTIVSYFLWKLGEKSDLFYEGVVSNHSSLLTYVFCVIHMPCFLLLALDFLSSLFISTCNRLVRVENGEVMKLNSGHLVTF